MVMNILIVGVGGQGTLLTSRVLGNLALSLGYDVKMSEVHGMSQRGGSVVTHVRYGDHVNSPLVEVGKADIILAFEKMEAYRWKHFLKKEGVILMNTQEINPMPVITGAAEYPKDIIEAMKKEVKKFFPVDALQVARDLGNIRTMNMVLVGVMASQMAIDQQAWMDVIAETVPAKTVALNQEAFIKGYNLVSEEVLS